jgi:hypothetical protein
MSELVALGESLRRDLEDWMDARCADWLMAHDLSTGLEALQSCARDTAALLAAGYQVAALDAWLTAGFRPADRAEFEQRAAAVAAVDSGLDPSLAGPDAAMRGPAAGMHSAGADARRDRAAEGAAPVRDVPDRSNARASSDTRTVPGARASSDSMSATHGSPDSRTASDARTSSDRTTAPHAALHPRAPDARTSSDSTTAPHALLHPRALDALLASPEPDALLASPAPARIPPSSAPITLGARTGAGARAETRPAGFQRLRGLQDLAARAHSVEGALPLLEATRHTAAPGMPSDEPAAGPAHARTAHRRGHAVPHATSDGASGTGEDPRWTLESSAGPIARAREEIGAVDHGDLADAGSVRLDELRASFRPLMEPAAADASWLSVGGGRIRPAQHARPEPAADRRRSDAEVFTGAASVSELATPAPRAARAHGGDPTPVASRRVDEISPGDIDSILEALDDDLERDFARLYGGG